MSPAWHRPYVLAVAQFVTPSYKIQLQQVLSVDAELCPTHSSDLKRHFQSKVPIDLGSVFVL